MAVQKILVTYNFTSYDQKALDFVIRNFNHSRKNEITLFNAYTMVPRIDTREATIMSKLHHNLTYLSQKVKEQENALVEAKQYLLKNGFSESQVAYIFRPRKKDVTSEIIDLVINSRFNIVVMNRKPVKVTRFFIGSVFNKVVAALQGVTVCIVS